MMQTPVYRVESAVEGYAYLIPEDDSARFVLSLDGNPTSTPQRLIRARLVRADSEGKELTDGDFFRLSGHLLCGTERVFSLLGPELAASGEWLDLRAAGLDYKVFHCTRLFDDVLDMQLSQVKRFQSTGRPMLITKYVFRDRVVSGEILFRNQETPMLDLFATETFRNLVESKSLTGLSFRHLWPDG